MSFLCQDPSHAEPFACHCQAEGGWLCEYYRSLQDLIARLERADAIIKDEIAGLWDPLGYTQIRLRAKAEGVRLALSYAEEALR